MSLRLLIVDDNRHFLEAARDLLEQEGMTVALAGNGAEAVERLEKLRPDVTLVDINLGAESGFDVARQLADSTGGESCRFVLISSYAEQDLRELFEASSATGFLSKSDLSGRAIRALVGAVAD